MFLHSANDLEQIAGVRRNKRSDTAAVTAEVWTAVVEAAGKKQLAATGGLLEKFDAAYADFERKCAEREQCG